MGTEDFVGARQADDPVQQRPALRGRGRLPGADRDRERVEWSGVEWSGVEWSGVACF